MECVCKEPNIEASSIILKELPLSLELWSKKESTVLPLAPVALTNSSTALPVLEWPLKVTSFSSQASATALKIVVLPVPASP